MKMVEVVMRAAPWFGFALMAGVVVSATSAREEIEERFFSFRDLFGARFCFVFGLSIAFAASSFFLSFFSFGGGALL